jgi:hypothetical protein
MSTGRLSPQVNEHHLQNLNLAKRVTPIGTLVNVLLATTTPLIGCGGLLILVMSVRAQTVTDPVTDQTPEANPARPTVSTPATLTPVGVYGVLAFGVSQRINEFGIRLALDATGEALLRLVVGDGLRIVATGVVAGLAAAALLTRSLGAFLFGVTLLDPLTFAAVPLTLALIALIACAIPAHRAMTVDPMTALRDE